jgi:hypothetical protein
LRHIYAVAISKLSALTLNGVKQNMSGVQDLFIYVGMFARHEYLFTLHHVAVIWCDTALLTIALCQLHTLARACVFHVLLHCCLQGTAPGASSMLHGATTGPGDAALGAQHAAPRLLA